MGNSNSWLPSLQAYWPDDDQWLPAEISATWSFLSKDSDFGWQSSTTFNS